ncbi:hypothetical protein BM1_02304 [Bipolaris maydis]|nr:hypothetical protein BM1_02304 [Bipolaris maydis]
MSVPATGCFGPPDLKQNNVKSRVRGALILQPASKLDGYDSIRSEPPIGWLSLWTAMYVAWATFTITSIEEVQKQAVSLCNRASLRVAAIAESSNGYKKADQTGCMAL